MAGVSNTFERYGRTWQLHPTKPVISDVLVEREMIRLGEAEHRPPDYFFPHYMEMRRLLWPKRYRHAWTDLMWRQFLEKDTVILMGCASSQKTSHASEFVLLDYWCFPENTCVLVSTTSVDKLESSVFGEIKMLWNEGRKICPMLAGNLLDHKRAITTDSLEEDEVRDMRKGIVGKACYEGKQWVGLGTLVGIKQERFRFLADELQFMAPTFLECLPNMRSNSNNLKVIGSGNPNHDPDSQLGVAAEPLEGWSAMPEPEKTTVWPIRLWNGVCINLVGTDSPNFHAPTDKPDPYPKLIGRKFSNIIEHDYGKYSPAWYTQVAGIMKVALAQARVITREICRQHHAHDKAVWMGTGITKIFACDPAYGGGDRCVVGHIEFGQGLDGKQILRVCPPEVLKINARFGNPEDQIANGVFDYLNRENIDPNNAFYDSFGKGTVGFAFARKFGANSPVPVDSGAQPTKRAVRDDLWVEEQDHTKRLKRCDEHYSKFVTEAWFSVRYAIEADQVRELPEAVMIEGCWRIYYTVAGDRIEVEPKDDMKERTGKSPDLFDWISVATEGARRRGFRIARLGTGEGKESNANKWLTDLVQKDYKLHKAKRLNYDRDYSTV